MPGAAKRRPKPRERGSELRWALGPDPLPSKLSHLRHGDTEWQAQGCARAGLKENWRTMRPFQQMTVDSFRSPKTDEHTCEAIVGYLNRG
jgi:hypothetical protein